MSKCGRVCSTPECENLGSVLVTGSRGGIGSAIVKALRATGKFDVYESDPPAGVTCDNDSDPTVFDHVVVAQGMNDETLSSQMWAANYHGVVSLASSFGLVWDNYTARHCFIAISSNSADIPRSPSVQYCASKAAVDMALKCLQRKYASHSGCEFYSLAPGQVATPMYQRKIQELGETAMARSVEAIPYKIPMPAEELAEIVVSILTTRGWRWAAGQTLRLDGGEH